MIAARLASLAPATRNVAEVAAVAGEAFSLSMVQEVARLTQGVVLDAFDELLDQHIVRESTGRSHYEYAFTHHLVHGAVYDESPNAARMLRHRRVARLLGETAGESDERAAQIALHYERGGERSKAGAHYARAARRAAALYANAEARDLVGRALELGEWTGRERLDLVLLAAEMMSRAGNLGAESATLDEAEQLAEKLDAPARCAVLERRITVAASHLRDVEWSAGVERLAECAALAGEQRWLGVAQEKRAERQAQRDGNFSGAVESYLDALEHFRRSGDEVACARVGALAAQHSLMLPNRAKEADGLVRDALRSSETANAVETRMAVLCVAASIAYERGDYEHMAELSASAVELSRETGDPVTESRARGLLGRSLQKLWRIPESIEQLREALRLSQELGHRLRSEGGAVALGSVLMEAGDHEAGIELCRRATSLSMPFLAVALMLIASELP
jgi:tetratricopeptide (TPR) repeat protein